MRCPKCQSPMETVNVEFDEAQRCTHCAGLWFHMRDYEYALESKAIVHALDIGDPKEGARQDTQRNILCPDCHVQMLKLAVHNQPHIHYESCPICYSTFFDAGELTDAAHFTLLERVKSFFSEIRKKTTSEP